MHNCSGLLGDWRKIHLLAPASKISSDLHETNNSLLSTIHIAPTGMLHRQVNTSQAVGVAYPGWLKKCTHFLEMRNKENWDFCNQGLFDVMSCD